MRAFLTEWLIRHGTEWVETIDLQEWNNAMDVGPGKRLSYAREGYLYHPKRTADRYRLTLKGLEYIKNDTE